MAEQTPKELKPVLAKITHVSELGKSEWYEVVYYSDGWQSFSGSDTFEDGEKVVEWEYCDIAINVNAKVLEALEREVIKARVSKDIAIKEKVLKHIVSEEVLDKYISDAQKHYETKVKPKYEK